MKTRSNHNSDDWLMTSAVRSIAISARKFFNTERRALLRQNAIRRAIANLIETERMRLAMTIAHRHDG
jgi:hypothetical protein